MESGSDEIQERLIEGFRLRLEENISVEPALNHLVFIQPEEKEQIRQKLRSDGEKAAASHLITVVLKRPHSEGWFRAFVDGLIHGGSELAAKYLELNPPSPDVEEENDYCVKLIQLLAPSLVTMKTEEVCPECLSRGIITEDDMEKVSIIYSPC